MKQTLTILALTIFSICKAQSFTPIHNQSFVLNGKLLGRDTGRIILMYPSTSGKYIRDTACVQKGKFQFTGLINEPSFAHLVGSSRDGNYANFFLESGNQTVTLEENNFDHIAMKGSKTQDENESLNKQLNELSREMDSINAQLRKVDSAYQNQGDSVLKNFDARKLRDLEEQIQNLKDKVISYRIAFVIQHPNSFVSPTELLTLMIVHLYPVGLVKPLYKGLSPRIKNSSAGKLCLQEIEKRSKLTAGNFLSNFKVKDLNDKNLSLAQFKGKYVLLEFWASWCVPCRQEIPHIKQVFDTYHSKGMEIIAISSDSKINEWKKAIQADSTAKWYHVLRNEEMEAIFKSIQAIPQQILLDRNGKIIWSSLDSNNNSWEDQLKQELNLVG